MKTFKEMIVHWSVIRYRVVITVMILFALVCGAFIPMIRVDTDPENMLSPDEAVRVFHNQSKKQFDLNDIVVLGSSMKKTRTGCSILKRLAVSMN